MSLQRPPLWQIIKPHLTVFDGALSLIVFLILSVVSAGPHPRGEQQPRSSG